MAWFLTMKNMILEKKKIEASTRNGIWQVTAVASLLAVKKRFSLGQRIYFPSENEKWLLKASLGFRTGGMTAGPAGDTGAGGRGVYAKGAGVTAYP